MAMMFGCTACFAYTSRSKFALLQYFIINLFRLLFLLPAVQCETSSNLLTYTQMQAICGSSGEKQKKKIISIKKFCIFELTTGFIVLTVTFRKKTHTKKEWKMTVLGHSFWWKHKFPSCCEIVSGRQKNNNENWKLAQDKKMETHRGSWHWGWTRMKHNFIWFCSIERYEYFILNNSHVVNMYIYEETIG